MKKIFVLLCLFINILIFHNLKVEASNKQVTLVAVGDNLIHHTIYQSVYKNNNYDFKPIYKFIKPYIKSHDIAFVNQESILGGSQLGLSSYPLFNSPYELGDALIDCGFNLISTANNHSMDKGIEGIKNSVHYWQQKDVVYSGTDIKPSKVKIFIKRNIRIGYIAYTYGTNGIPIPKEKDYLVNSYSYNKAKEDILSVKDKVDMMIVSMHWGDEYHNMPSALQKSEAVELSNLGVDLILGHHPHVIEPYEVIQTKNHQTHVIYSLGNFLSDQSGIDRLIGMAFSITIVKDSNNARVHLRNPRAKLFYTYHHNGQFKNLFFEMLDENILTQYEKYFEQKKQLIQLYTNQISVY